MGGRARPLPRSITDYFMKISLVLEDVGAGPQVVFSSHNPEEALAEYKTRATTGKLALIVNPRLELHRKAPKVLASAAPVVRKKRETVSTLI